ncbi:MAG: DNA recombination protein RmuC [Bryobacterales bacterium]|nr:DNA recombination protein RmuC [Bryobacterales bacterium]
MMVAFVTLLLGLAVGAFLVWFSKEGQTQQAVAAAQGENMATIAALEEKASALSQRETQLNQELAATRHEMDQHRVRAGDEMNLLRQEMTRLREEQAQLHAQLFTERQMASEKQRLVAELEQRFTEAIGNASQQAMEAASQQAFAGLSEKVIENGSQGFLELAKSALEEFRPLVEIARGTNGHASGDAVSPDAGAPYQENRGQELAEMVKPLDETLRKVEEQLREMERERSGDYRNLLERVKELGENQTELRAEAGRLASAMRTPVQRGLWGEVQLRRVVEMAGMLEHCEFRMVPAPALETDETLELPTVESLLNGYRPSGNRIAQATSDLTVHLPGARSIPIHAHAPVDAYLDALASETEQDRDTKMALHAAGLRAHVDALSASLAARSQAEHPDFVVSFLPGEAFLSAALAQDPALLEYSLSKRVLLTTPTTLVSLLKTASYGWQQEDVAENARQVRELGQEMYDRLRVLTGHFNGIKRGLESTLRAYNDAAGSMESRVLSTAQRFKELGAANGDGIGAPAPVAFGPKEIHMPELRALVGASSNGDGD